MSFFDSGVHSDSFAFVKSCAIVDVPLHITFFCHRVCSEFSHGCVESLQRLLELLDFKLSHNSFPVIE